MKLPEETQSNPSKLMNGVIKAHGEYSERVIFFFFFNKLLFLYQSLYAIYWKFLYFSSFSLIELGSRGVNKKLSTNSIKFSAVR